MGVGFLIKTFFLDHMLSSCKLSCIERQLGKFLPLEHLALPSFPLAPIEPGKTIKMCKNGVSYL